MKVKTLEQIMRRHPVKRKSTAGNAMFEFFAPDERYCVDFAPDFKEQGWEQYDTDQDAHYFGVWVNPSKRLTLSYAEGDWRMVECATVENYNKEIQGMNEFYGKGFIAKCFDMEGQITVIEQDRNEFFVKD